MVDLLNDTLSVARFWTKEGEEVSPQTLRRAFSDADGRTSQVRKTLTAYPEVPIAHLERLTDYLRTLLKDYLSERGGVVGYSGTWIGPQDVQVGAHESRIIVGGYRTSAINICSSISHFAKTLVHASGRIGAHFAAQIVYEWMSGKPRTFKVSAVLAGVRIDNSVQLADGVIMYNLPLSSEHFPNAIPDIEIHVAGGLLGKTVIEISGSTTPSLFSPSLTDEDTYAVQSSVALGDMSLQAMIAALSLVSNRRVDCVLLWSDQHDTRALDEWPSLVLLEPRKRLHWGRVGEIQNQDREIIKVIESASPTPNLSANSARRAWKLLPELIGRMEKEKRFKVSVDRWMEAISHDKQSMNRLIDLRIALEALYIESDQGELSFRLALTGAPHLGTDLDKRKAIRDTFRKFYNISSRAVHGTEIKSLKEADVAVIEKATELCRDGILKIVETKHRPNWDTLLLS